MPSSTGLTDRGSGSNSQVHNSEHSLRAVGEKSVEESIMERSWSFQTETPETVRRRGVFQSRVWGLVGWQEGHLLRRGDTETECLGPLLAACGREEEAHGVASICPGGQDEPSVGDEGGRSGAVLTQGQGV